MPDQVSDQASEQLLKALARTVLLLRLDAFPALDAGRDGDIVDGLRAVGVRIVADRSNVASPNGQTALVTLVCQCAMLGIRVDLDIPDVPQLAPQPPLLADLPLGSALTAWTDALFPGSLSRVDEPLLTFAIGDTPTPGAVHVAGGDQQVDLDTDPRHARPWEGASPFGAIAAAAAGAAEAMRAAIPSLATTLDQPPPTDVTWKPRPLTPIHLELPGDIGLTGSLGLIDLVSAGAISHAAMYTLLRVPGFAAHVRTIDRDELARSNTNRYALARAHDLGQPKVEQLASYATDAVRITGVPLRLDGDAMASLGELAPRVLVGVDDIPTRWFIQRQQPSWLGVGATTHGFVVVSDHLPGHPCAGCVHPIDEENRIEEIPTIGFVSLWAGLLLAGALLAPDASFRLGTRRVEAHPMGLFGPHAVKALPQSRNARCPVCGVRATAA